MVNQVRPITVANVFSLGVMMFEVGTRLGENGETVHDYFWLNGSQEPSYGFAIGSTTTEPFDLSKHSAEETIRGFLDAFFTRRIAHTDFPEFVASRGGEEASVD